MGIASGRRLPQRETPFLDKNGLVSIDWYDYFRKLDEQLGGLGFSTVVASPARGGVLLGPSGIAGAAGTLTLTVDGVDYNVVHE